MSVRADQSNSPFRKKEKKRIQERDHLIAKYKAEGLSDEHALEKAQKEMRDNQIQN